MKNIILITLLVTCSTLSNGVHFNKVKKEEITYRNVVSQILKNKPKLDKKVARKLASSIVKHATNYKTSPYIAAAIAMQESSYSFAVNVNKDSSIDVGFFQINSNTAKAHGINLKRLMADMDYSVEAYFKVMVSKNKMCKKLKADSWACYHSKNKSLRVKYQKLVGRYLASY